MSPVKSPNDLSARDAGKKDKIVVEKDEAEEILPGWTKEVKVRKGSATKIDRYYTDPVTGYIFRSLKDVQRYLKTGEVGRLAIKPKNNDCVNMDTQDEKLHIEEKQETSESKERMSESWRHKRPLEDGSNGCKTRSKSSETDKSELPHRASKRLAGVTVDAPLPPPSPPEPQTRQATRLAEVAGDAPKPPPSPPEPKTRQARRLAGVTVDASPPSPLLPERKTRQATRLAGVAVDASLPPSSPSDPKTRQATQLAGIKADTPPPPPYPSPSATEPKTHPPTRLAEAAVDASLPSQPEPKTHQATLQAGIKIDSQPPSPPDTRTTRQAGTKTDASVPSPAPPASKTRQAAQQAGIKIDSSPQASPDSKTLQPTQSSEMKIVASPPEPKTRQAKRALGIRDNASPASPPEPKTRRATRQAGIKIDPPPPSLPDTRTSRQLTARQVNNKKPEVVQIRDKHNENAEMDENPDHKHQSSFTIPPVNQESHEMVQKDEFKADEKPKPHYILPPVTPKQHCKEVDVGPSISLSPKVQQPSTVFPPGNLGKQESPLFNPTVSNPVPQDAFGVDDMKPESSTNFSMNDLWTDPCIEFAVKTLTGAIPFADLNKVNFSPSPLEVPLEELWTDPCIEFAVKTLTGAIPVGENDYLQHQPTSSSNSNPRPPNDFSLPDVSMSFCQTEVVSKHYEAGQSKQQDSVIPTHENGSLQKSGNIINRSNGQCSRSRFFQ